MVAHDGRGNVLVVVHELGEGDDLVARTGVPADAELLQELLTRFGSALVLGIDGWIIIVHKLSDRHSLVPIGIKFIVGSAHSFFTSLV